MTKGGLSTERLGRMRDVMTAHVEGGMLPGLVTLAARRGEVHVDVIGTKAFGARDPMRRDTLFRITSMTKPITAAATMILVEECKLQLQEPVDRLLPELANRRVLSRIDAPLDDTVPAARPITVLDLLTFRFGLGMTFGPANAHPIQRAIAELGIAGFGAPDPSAPHDPDEWLRRLGTLPLMHQPGERWLYNTGSYVLGVLVARASGQPFETFLRERLFEPLGMKDTAFSVSPAQRDRLATAYWPNADTGALELHDGPDGRWSRPPLFPDGGAGLVSTVDDYAAFGRMLLDKGLHRGRRVLSRPSVEAMTTDQLTPAQKTASTFAPGYWDTRGWGLGVSVVTRRDDVWAVPGRFGWDGGFGTSWASDPTEDMVAILMTQCAGFPSMSRVYLDFWTGVYQAIDD